MLYNVSCSFSPEYLVEQNVIIVTVNYRLSVLGFLCLPDAGCYGNAGLKDQVNRIHIRIIIAIKSKIQRITFAFSDWRCNGFKRISPNSVEIRIM